MDKINKHKEYIKKLLLEINDKEQYTTKYCKKNQLFISMITGEYKERNLYSVISSNILKVRKEINGTSQKRCKLYITGKDLKSALRDYYKI
jgi:hypothetical protein